MVDEHRLRLRQNLIDIGTDCMKALIITSHPGMSHIGCNITSHLCLCKMVTIILLVEAHRLLQRSKKTKILHNRSKISV